MGILQEAKKRRKAIIVVALAVSMVTIVLGLGLGLGLQLQNCRNQVVQTSCRDRCFEPYDNESPSCRCDHQCKTTGGCCYDFHDLCLQASEQWECSKLRCGEKRLSNSKCHCSDDCMESGDCCTNYRSVCHGEQEWKDDTCEEIVSPECPKSFSRQPLLLVSLDGFRAEYLQTWSKIIPVLHQLKICGAHAPYMQAAFPSMTFPNHYTIVTGLYSESHGLVDNNMYDPAFDASFSLSNTEKSNPRWYLGQPVWLTVMNQGLKAGTYFWPGSDVNISGRYPNIWRDYNGKVPFEERVFEVLKWLRLPDHERPDFYTLYLEEPDKSGHSYGPVSGGVVEAIMGVDRIIGQLMNGLKQMKLHRCVNIIIVADHGMESISCNRAEVLQDMVGNINNLFVTQGTFGRIRARYKDQSLDSVRLVANMTCQKPNQKIKPYLKAHLPKRFHYANSRRIEDVAVLVEPSWLFMRSPGSYSLCDGGGHGYDNDVPSMQAMFLSYGPKFLYKTQVEPFSNIELYNLMCDVLEITPAENNGTHGSLNQLLRNPVHNPTLPAELSAPEKCPLLSLTPTHNLSCSCSGKNEAEMNARLQLTDAEVAACEAEHTLFGRPTVTRAGQTYCLLHHYGYVTAYNKHSYMPLWSSFTISPPSNPATRPPADPDCLRADVRIPANHSSRCDQYAAAPNITTAYLYPPSLNRTAEEMYDGLIMSNVVPMYPEFKRMWNFFQNALLGKYARLYNGTNVVCGPAFDYNCDGLYDTAEQIEQFLPDTLIPIPTHYFVVLTSCNNTQQPVESCQQELQTVSFLIPHRPDNAETCNSDEDLSIWVENLLWFHQARVRDVELITGLDFYHDSKRPVAELLRLKARPTAAIKRPT